MTAKNGPVLHAPQLTLLDHMECQQPTYFMGTSSLGDLGLMMVWTKDENTGWSCELTLCISRTILLLQR